jgi:uncharacterized membrane protein
MTATVQTKRKSTVATVAFIAVGAALSGLGGFVKLPSPVGSVALDSAPGFFAAAYFNAWVGGAVGLIGHLLSAASAGFPAGALHLLVAVGMFVACWAFGFITRSINRVWGVWLAGLVGVVINNAIPFVAVAIGAMKLEAAIGLVFPFLIVAAVVNVALAAVVLLGLRALHVPGI